MRLKGLDLNLLIVLDAVLSGGSISAAARRIHLSQPATSNALARLRQYFGDDLLVRAGKGMILTARAEALREPVREILMHVESTVATPPAFDAATAERQFTVVASDFTASVLMQPLIRRAARAAPRVRFRLLTQNGPSPEALLTQGEADVLILPQQYLVPQHPSATLFQEKYVCVTWNASRWHGHRISLRQYKEAGHVTAQFGDGRLPAFDSWLMDSQGLQRREEVVAHSMAVQAELVVGTDRIATMHERLARRAARYLPVDISVPPIRIPTLTECAQWNRARAQDPGLRWLLKQTEEIARSV